MFNVLNVYTITVSNQKLKLVFFHKLWLLYTLKSLTTRDMTTYTLKLSKLILHTVSKIWPIPDLRLTLRKYLQLGKVRYPHVSGVCITLTKKNIFCITPDVPNLSMPHYRSHLTMHIPPNFVLTVPLLVDL